MRCCAFHCCDPQRAAFTDFGSFWKFVAGPLNGGSFGPNTLDGTFAPQVVFYKAAPAGQTNLSPCAGLQFFGEVKIDAKIPALVVDLRELGGASVSTKTLAPQFGWSCAARPDPAPAGPCQKARSRSTCIRYWP